MEILDHVSLDEAMEYVESIKDMDVQGYLMQLYIAQNPHTKEPKKMIESLQKELGRGKKLTYKTNPQAQAEDGATDKLRKLLNKTP